MKKEAFDLGVVMDDAAIAAGANFNDEMDKLTAVITGVKNVVGGALMPIFTKWVSVARDLIVANKDIIATRLESVVLFLSDAMTVAWRVGKGFYDTIKSLADMFGGFETVLKWVGIALLGLGSLAILSAIGSVAIAAGGLIAALLSLNAAALSAAAGIAVAWIAAAAIPILVGLAVAAVVLAIEDVYTYLQGGQSIFGSWVKWIYDLFDQVATWAGNIGSKIYDAIVKPIKDGFAFISDTAKKLLGIDLNKKWIPDSVAPQKSKSGAMDLHNGIYNKGPVTAPWIDTVKPVDIKPPRPPKFGTAELNMDSPWKDMANPIITPSTQVMAAAPIQNQNTTLQNNITVNANGLNEEQARRVVSEEVQRSQTDMFKRAGQNSARRNRE